MGKHSVRAQLKAYRRQVAALSVQKVWRGRCHRKQHGVFEFQPQPSERAHGRSAGAKPFWVKGADVDSELDMYHGPVELPEGHHALSARSSASPNRSEPLPRRGHRRGRGPAGAPMVRKMRPLGSGGGGVGGEDAASTTLPLLNHALDNGATRIQAVARGRRARKAYILTVAGAVKMQSIIRRYLAKLAVRAEIRRRKVGSAIGTSAVQRASLQDWLASNGLISKSSGNNADLENGGRDIVALLRDRGGITKVEQLAELAEHDVARLAAGVFGNAQLSQQQVFVDAVTLLRLTFLATNA